MYALNTCNDSILFINLFHNEWWALGSADLIPKWAKFNYLLIIMDSSYHQKHLIFHLEMFLLFGKSLVVDTIISSSV